MNFISANAKPIIMTAIGGIATIVGGVLTAKATGEMMGNEVVRSLSDGASQIAGNFDAEVTDGEPGTCR